LHWAISESVVSEFLCRDFTLSESEAGRMASHVSIDFQDVARARQRFFREEALSHDRSSIYPLTTTTSAYR
jgi:hypothetical protein